MMYCEQCSARARLPAGRPGRAWKSQFSNRSGRARDSREIINDLKSSWLDGCLQSSADYLLKPICCKSRSHVQRTFHWLPLVCHFSLFLLQIWNHNVNVSLCVHLDASCARLVLVSCRNVHRIGCVYLVCHWLDHFGPVNGHRDCWVTGEWSCCLYDVSSY